MTVEHLFNEKGATQTSLPHIMDFSVKWQIYLTTEVCNGSISSRKIYLGVYH